MKKKLSLFISIIMLVNIIFVSTGSSMAFAAAGLTPVVDFGTGNTGNIRVAEFDVTPSNSNMDALVGFSGNSASPSSAGDLPVALRLNSQGSFEAANGAAFSSVQSLAYTAGNRYNIKAVINLSVKTYDIWVTASGSTPVLIAKDYGFAGTAQPMNDVGKLYSIVNSSGTCSVENARIIQSTFISKSNFANNCYPIESDNLKNLPKVIKFDIVPASNQVDALVSYVDTSTNVTGFGNLAYIFHMDFAGGFFDIRNDGAYTKLNTVPTKAGTLYHVKLIPDLTTKLYDVWVAEEGQAPVKLAEGYKIRNFSSTTYPLNNIGKICVYSAVDDAITVSNHLTLDKAQLTSSIGAVNSASTAEEMKAALTSNSLGLDLVKFSTMREERRQLVLQDMIAGKPYEDDMKLQSVFEKSVTLRRDVEKPTAPTNVTAVPSDSLQIKLSWTASTDDTEILYYKVFRDGRELGTIKSGTSYVDLGLQPETTYSYVVKAYDSVLNETASASVTATTCLRSEINYFPFTPSVLTTAFNQGLLKYSLTDSGVQVPGSNPRVNYKYVMDWNTPYMYSATALYYLTLASIYDPDYVGPDGVTTVSQRALAHIRSVIAGGNEPGFSGGGLSAQGYIPVVQSIAIAKAKVPAIWGNLTAEEKSKIDLMMQAALVGSHWGYSDKNNFTTGIDQTGNFTKTWNPNFRVGGVTAGLLAAYYLGNDNANSFLKNFNYDDFMAKLNAARLTNISVVFSNTGKAQLELYTKNDDANGFTYMGHTLNEPGLWIKELVDHGFNLPVSPVGGATVPVSTTFPYGTQGFLVKGFDEFPNLGATGMGLEFNSVDANGGRSSLDYVNMAWRGLIEAVYSLGIFKEAGPTGLTGSDMEAMLNKVGIGTEDLNYKGTNGYNNYDKGQNKGTDYLTDDVEYLINRDLWLQVIDNPGTAVQAVNTAANASTMKTAVESMDLGLILYGYNDLSQTGKDAVIQSVLTSRPSYGYYNKAAIQQVVYNAVKSEAIKSLNSASTVTEVMNALKSNALGVYIPNYDALSNTLKQNAAQMLMDTKPQGGYADKASIRSAVSAIVTAVTADPAVIAVNNASSVSSMRTAIEATALALNLTAYNPLSETDKNGVAQRLISSRPLLGYLNKAAIQAVLAPAIENQLLVVPMQEVNSASTIDAMKTAIEATALGLNLSTYSNASVSEKEAIAQRLLDNRPVNGYAEKAAIQIALDGILNGMTGKVSAIAVEDSFVEEGNPSKTNGLLNYLIIKDGWGTQRRIYVKYDLSSFANIDPDSIWAIKAPLFPISLTAPATINVYSVDSTWKEAEITWSNAPVYATLPLASIRVSEANKYYDFDITAYAKAKLQAGERYISLVFTGFNKENNQVNVDPREKPLTGPRIAAVTFDPVKAVNTSSNLEQIKLSIKSESLALNLSAYNELSALNQDKAAQKLLEGRPTEGYANKEAVQTALDNAISAIILKSVTITADKSSMQVSDMAQISISGKLDNGSDAELTAATIEYRSSNPDIASVDSNGVVRANKPGNIEISAIVTLNDIEVQSNVLTINVEEPKSVDANLSYLRVSGISVAAFNPDTTEYDVVLPAVTTEVPEVTAGAAAAGKATVVVTRAERIPGTTTVAVTAENQAVTKAYRINFTLETPAPAPGPVANTDTTAVVSAIEAAEEGSDIEVDINNNKLVAKEIFDVIKGTNKTVTFQQNGIYWTFKGTDITEDTKNVDMTVNVAKLQSSAAQEKAAISAAVKNAEVLVISFAENGKLPGKAVVKVKLDENWLTGRDKNNVYIYYFNPVSKLTEIIAKDLKVDAEGYVEFEITHNSDYIVSDKELTADETTIKAEMPKTGSVVDAVSLSALGILLILAGLAVTGFRKKRDIKTITKL